MGKRDETHSGGKTQEAGWGRQRPEQSEEERDPCRQHSLKQHSGDRPGDRSQDEGQGLLQPHSCQGELQAV